jgi:hypothetical protein
MITFAEASFVINPDFVLQLIHATGPIRLCLRFAFHSFATGEVCRRMRNYSSYYVGRIDGHSNTQNSLFPWCYHT